MAVTESNQEIELVGPGSPDRRSALRLILAGDLAPSLEVDQRVRRLEQQADQQRIRLDWLLVARSSARIVAASLAIESPGRAAMAHLAVAGNPPAAHNLSVRLLTSLQARVWSGDAAMLQSLISPSDSAAARAYRDSGFREIAELIYLERSGGPPPANSTPELDLSWQTYSAATHGLFLRALEESYVETLDCPSLTGLRGTEDVLAGHRATGLHDPSLWFIALAESQTAGVLLLSPIGEGDRVEVVYMGVAAAFRRRRVAHALLGRAVRETALRGFGGLTLAVDAANAPALALYDHWGFREFARRRAWMAVPASPS